MAGRLDDFDPEETGEWIEALEALHEADGPERVRYIMDRLLETARDNRLSLISRPVSAYQNTIPTTRQGRYPGDLAIEERLTAILRWNALAMVIRGNEAYGGLGGHIASYASAAEIFETGFNHFFDAEDMVFFQPHSAPGVYARAFLEGRLSEDDLDRFRQEVGDAPGLPSYPHPWLMPDFWQFPTGSMGLGPISAVYQARFMRYMQARGLARTNERHVWGVFGDGEMDEPESIGGLTLAAREKLDNLTFIVNCNLQRLDGPVRGNGQIIQELESLFLGAGWNVIKVLWGTEWDGIFSADRQQVLLRRFAETVDGQYQNLGSKDGDYNRASFFGTDPESAALVEHLTDEEIHKLKRGGHDFRKLHAAFAAARAHKGQPTVILAKTKKGYGMGGAGESRMMAHQAKKLDFDALREFRDRFDLPLTDADLREVRYHKPAPDSPEMRYLAARRTALNGPLPRRRQSAASLPALPELASYGTFALAADGKPMSTTVAAVRMMNGMLKADELGPRIVPIVADEARTFGMDNLFRQVGIYSPEGQLYEPEDAGSMLYYREKSDGQLLEEGITEAGAISSWTAAATAYSTHGVALLPIFIFYSMFGFQRVGDLIWAAADQRARGFLLGATAGRTTLSGEGLQHQDGSSQLAAATIPTCRAYDPAYAYELAVILEAGTRRMITEQRDEFYYVTVMNEAYAQPSIPEAPGIRAGILAGGYSLPRTESGTAAVRLLGSGAILPQVVEAAERLAAEGIAAEVISVTSYSELERGAREVERARRLGDECAGSHLETLLPGTAPVIAATDYVRAVPSLIAPYLSAPITVLGTDGFGRSATRAALRAFFEVDAASIALAAAQALARRGALPDGVLARLRATVASDPGNPPWRA
ncbi:alpha-ketoglutarate dehydrogenase [Profundibacterium mesophilum]|uniref:Pyruvate dehydrogenase E1 component n=1 Tax=Profundibacterium mesophilum KAUST100406-0324 TaxID=1037889 RepID=A0A921NPN1_9RHOB|nr:alpha-ketoglutarate dehydrogenase [Profundibacterium mesophilum]KAF0674810.1 Pyruvate dehydrogenase E1 component [Profundibacterium mesophilum KAUST100406-0324]